MARPRPGPRPTRSGAVETEAAEGLAPDAGNGSTGTAHRSGRGETSRPSGPYETSYDIRHGYVGSRTIVRP